MAIGRVRLQASPGALDLRMHKPLLIAFELELEPTLVL